jgi:hypothetical protein
MPEKNFNSTYSRQIGEHMVVAELGRRKIIATPFAGNVPDIDILAYRGGRAIPIQVKALAKGSWSFNIESFCEISDKPDGRQIIGKPVERADDQTICIFMHIGERAGEDAFYILTWRQLRDLAITSYDQYLRNNNGIRPVRPKSRHLGLGPKDLEEFRDNWKLIENQLESKRA